MRLIYCIKRNIHIAQKFDILLFGQRFGGEIEQFRLPGQHVGAHLRDGRLVERRIEEMGDARLGREGAHGVHLVLHQRDQGGNDDRHALHEHGRKLIAEGFPAARRHQPQGVSAFANAIDDVFLYVN